MAGWRRCIQKLPPLPAGTLLALHPSLFLLLWEAAVFLTVCLLPDPPCCSRKAEGESVESGGDRKAGTTLFLSKQGET